METESREGERRAWGDLGARNIVGFVRSMGVPSIYGGLPWFWVLLNNSVKASDEETREAAQRQHSRNGSAISGPVINCVSSYQEAARESEVSRPRSLGKTVRDSSWETCLC